MLAMTLTASHAALAVTVHTSAIAAKAAPTAQPSARAVMRYAQIAMRKTFVHYAV